jgi:hypothetical protein
MDYDVSWWRLRELGQPDLFVPRSCCLLSNAPDDLKAFLDPHPLNMSACQSLDQSMYQIARHTEVSSLCTCCVGYCCSLGNILCDFS